MISSRTSIAFASIIFIGASICALSCSEEAGNSEYKDFGNNKSGPGNAAAEARLRLQQKGNGSVEKVEADDNKIDLPELSETAFISGPRRRDPFLPFFEVLVKQDTFTQDIQREVKLKDYDISELKLIGIITNIGDPRAMVTTPDKTGFVLRRGDYVGRADYIKQGTSGEAIQVNWRVARIHGAGKEEERGIYLSRDDPTTARGVDITRFLPLHPLD